MIVTQLDVQSPPQGERGSLFVTGGSDYHGIPNRYPYHLGEYVVDSNLINQFIERIRCISA